MTRDTTQPGTARTAEPTEGSAPSGEEPQHGHDGSSESDREGSENTSPARAGEQQPLPMRRRSLLSSLAGTTLAGAASAAMDGAITPARGAEDDGDVSEERELKVGIPVEITNARPVQAVTNTDYTENGKNKRWDDPDLVTDKPASVAFNPKTDVDSVPPRDENPEEIPAEITCKITTHGNGTETHEFTLPWSNVREMLNNEDVGLPKAVAPGPFPEQTGDYGVKLPSFSVDKDLESVKIELAPDEKYIQADPVTIGGDQEGDPAMPPIHEDTPTFRIGFIGVRDPSGDDSNFISTENANVSLEEVSRKTVEYMEDMFPAKNIEGVVYHEPVQSGGLKKHIPGIGNVLIARKDAAKAKAKLWKAAKDGELREPHATIISGEGPIEQIDHVVMFPGAYYMDDYLGLDMGGTHWWLDLPDVFPEIQTYTAGVAQIYHTPSTMEDRIAGTAERAVHETAHYLLPRMPYEGTGLAKEDDDDHIADIVRCEGYEYTGQKFVVNKRAYGIMKDQVEPEKTGWITSYTYQKLIEGDMTTWVNEIKPVKERLKDWMSDNIKQNIDGNIENLKNIFSGGAVIDETGEIHIAGGTLDDGPLLEEPPTGESSGESGQADTVQVKVIGMNGEELDSREYPHTVEMTATETDEAEDSLASETVSGAALFTLPFPETATEVVLSYQGASTTVQPLAVNIETTARKLPPEAFEGETRLAALSTGSGEAEREALIDAAQRMGDALDQDAYTAALDVLDSEVAPIIRNLNADYPGAVNVPDSDELQTTVETTRARIQRFADELEDSEGTSEDLEGGGGGGSISTERTSLHDQNDGAC